MGKSNLLATREVLTIQEAAYGLASGDRTLADELATRLRLDVSLQRLPATPYAHQRGPDGRWHTTLHLDPADVRDWATERGIAHGWLSIEEPPGATRPARAEGHCAKREAVLAAAVTLLWRSPGRYPHTTDLVKDLVEHAYRLFGGDPPLAADTMHRLLAPLKREANFTGS